MQNFHIYQNIIKTYSPIHNSSLYDVLSYIKDNPDKDIIEKARQSGKGDKNLNYPVKVWKRYNSSDAEKHNKKGRYVVQNYNLYDYVKSTKIHCITWSALFNKKRSKKTVDKFTDYIYIDVDDFTVHSKEEVKRILSSSEFPYTVAVWDSFGGNGVGALVKAKNLTVDNYKSTWTSLYNLLYEVFSIKIDKQTKDFTRINVLSYDKNIFIRPEDKIATFYAVEPTTNYTTLSFKGDNKIHKSLIKDTLSYLLDKFYFDEGSISVSENRLNYYFYQKFYSNVNQWGIELDYAHKFLLSQTTQYPLLFGYRDDTTIYDIGRNQYDTYSDQFGELLSQVSESNYYDLETIESINNVYNGNAEILLEYLLEILSNKKYDTLNQKNYALTILAKQEGIVKKKLYTFFKSKNINFDDEAVSKVYGNPNYKFGIKFNFSNDYIEKQRKNFILKYTENDKYIIIENNKKVESLSFNSDYYLKNRVKYLKQLSKSAVINGVDKSELIQWLNEKIVGDEEYKEIIVNKVYNYYQYRFGLKLKKNVKLNKFESYFNIIEKRELNSNQKFSNSGVNLTKYENLLVWADTGIGKTTHICNDINEKRIILVPVIPALLAIEERYGCSVYYEKKKTVKQGDNLIVCSYSSYPKLYNLLKSWKTDLSEYSLYFDEQHNLAVSSQQSYRGSELNYIIDNMSEFKRRIFLSGTPSLIFHPEIKDYDVIRVTYKTKKEKKYKIVHYTDEFESLNKGLVKGKLNLIYLQNKKEHGKLGKLLHFLKNKGWDSNKIQLINADRKLEDEFQYLVKHEKINSDIEILITTSIIVEAINILNKNVASLHFLNFENPALLEQMANRTRLKLPETIYLYKSIKYKASENLEGFDVVALQNELIKQSKILLQFLNLSKNTANYNFVEQTAQKLVLKQIFDKNALIRQKNGAYAVDYLSIANIVFEKEKQYAYANEEYLKEYLKQYNWICVEVRYDENYMSQELKDDIKAHQLNKKEEYLEDINLIIDNIEKSGEKYLDILLSEDNITVFEQNKYPDIELQLRYKVHYLCRYLSFELAIDKVREYINDWNASDKKWKQFTRQLNICSLHKKGAFINKTTLLKNKSYNKLLDFYNYCVDIDKGNTLDELFYFLKRNNIKVADKDAALIYFEQYFMLKPELNGKKQLIYYFKGLNVNLDIFEFATEVYGWAKYKKVNDESFLIDEILDLVKGSWNRKPFLQNINLSKNQIVHLIRDYVSIERSTSKRINGKRVSAYKIKSLTPDKCIDIYDNIIPQRKTSAYNKHIDDMTIDEIEMMNDDFYFKKAVVKK